MLSAVSTRFCLQWYSKQRDALKWPLIGTVLDSEVDRKTNCKDENSIKFQLCRNQKRTVLAASQCFRETKAQLFCKNLSHVLKTPIMNKSKNTCVQVTDYSNLCFVITFLHNIGYNL